MNIVVCRMYRKSKAEYRGNQADPENDSGREPLSLPVPQGNFFRDGLLKFCGYIRRSAEAR